MPFALIKRASFAWLLLFASFALVGCDAFTQTPMPVDLTTQTSRLGKGRAVVLYNRLDKPLTVTVVQERKGADEKVIKEGQVTLNPQKPTEIGWVAGWRWEDGDIIRIYHDSYIPIAEQMK